MLFVQPKMAHTRDKVAYNLMTAYLQSSTHKRLLKFIQLRPIQFI